MKMTFTKAILLSLLLGLAAGVGCAYLPENVFAAANANVLVPVGKIFIGLIKMLVVPIVFCSIAIGVFQLGHPKTIGKIGGKSLLYFLFTTTVAVSLAMTLALLLKPGEMQNLHQQAAAATPDVQGALGLVDTLVGIVPNNPFAAMVEGNMLQIIFFALLLGLGISLVGDKAAALKKLLEQANEVLMKMMHLVMYTAPFGAFALIASAIGSNGIAMMQQMGMYVVVVLLALLLHFLITYGLTLRLLGGMSLLTLVRKFYPAMIVAFSTSSSNASLPVSLETAQKKLGVSPSISTFVQSLGATINMDGTSIMQGVATIFIAQIYHVDLSFVQLLTVVLTAVLASIGTAGVPAVGLVTLTIILEQVGLPAEGIGLILGIDRILDMLRTVTNITGDAVCAVIIDRGVKRDAQPRNA
jgi:Na+/H+-dicarboxylate symporter